MKTNENLLNSIGKSIRMWRDNCFPPFQRAYGTWLLVLVSVNAGIWFYITSDWSVQFVGNIAGLLVFPMLGRKVLQNAPDLGKKNWILSWQNTNRITQLHGGSCRLMPWNPIRYLHKLLNGGISKSGNLSRRPKKGSRVVLNSNFSRIILDQSLKESESRCVMQNPQPKGFGS